MFNEGVVETDPFGPYVLTSNATNPCVGTESVRLQSAKFDAVTYKVGIEYDIADRVFFYADTAKGFKSGGVQTLPVPTGIPFSFEPEYLIAYEGGIKSRFFGNTLQLNTDVYYYDYKNKQLVVTGAPIAPNPFPSTPTVNVGRAKVYGLETAADWRITPNDRLSVSVAYNRSKVTKATSAADNLAVGDSLPNAPRWTKQVAYEHRLPIGNDYAIAAGGEASFFSGYFIDTNKTRLEAYQPRFHRVDAHISLESVDGTVAVTAFANNLGNVVVRSAAFPGNRVILEAPRTYGVSLRKEF